MFSKVSFNFAKSHKLQNKSQYERHIGQTKSRTVKFHDKRMAKSGKQFHKKRKITLRHMSSTTYWTETAKTIHLLLLSFYNWSGHEWVIFIYLCELSMLMFDFSQPASSGHVLNIPCSHWHAIKKITQPHNQHFVYINVSLLRQSLNAALKIPSHIVDVRVSTFIFPFCHKHN